MTSKKFQTYLKNDIYTIHLAISRQKTGFCLVNRSEAWFLQRAYRGEGFSALFTFCPNCPSIISPRILGKIGAVVGVPRACQKFWGFFCLVVCSSLPDGSGRLMEGPTWQTQNVNKAEKHTPKVDAACCKVGL